VNQLLPRLVKKRPPVVLTHHGRPRSKEKKPHQQAKSTQVPVTPQKKTKKSAHQRLVESETYDQRRVRKLLKFERKLAKQEARYPGTIAHRDEILPYFRAMVDSGHVRCRPTNHARRIWILTHPDRDIAARELFSIAFRQRCASVDWPTEQRQGEN